MRTQRIGLVLAALGIVVLVGISLWIVLLGPHSPETSGTADDTANDVSQDETDGDDAHARADDEAARDESRFQHDDVEIDPVEDPVTLPDPEEDSEAEPAHDDEEEEEEPFDGEWHGSVVLRGVVLYGDTGEPVVAPLAVELSPRAQADAEPMRATGEPDEHGRFEVRFDEVTVRVDAFRAELRISVPKHEDAREPNSADAVQWHAQLGTTLDTDNPVDLGTIFLWDTIGEAVVHGRVTAAATGAPIAGAQIVLHDTMHRTPEHSSRVLAVTLTDEDGHYRFEELHPARISVAAEAQGYAAGASAMQRLAAGEAVELNLELSPQRHLRGIVVEAETQEPLAGAFVGVVAQPEPHAVADMTVSAADGSFELGGLGPGGWILFAELDGYTPGFEMFAVAPNEETLEPMTIELQGGFTLRGRVVDTDGAPVEQYTLRAWRQPDPGPEAIYQDAFGQMLARTQQVDNADGRFSYGPLAEPGPHTVEVVDGFHARTLTRDVQVGPDAPEVEIVLEAGASLTGRVLHEVDSEEPEPLSGARIALMRTLTTTGEEYPFEESRDLIAYSAGNGRYRLKGLPVGQVHLRVTHPEFAPQDVTLELTAGEEQEHDILFVGEEARLSGRAFDREGEPLAGRLVIAQGMGVEHRVDVMSDAEGLFDFGTIAPGTYLVMILGAGFQGIEISKTVTLNRHEVREIELTPPAGAVEVTGRLTMQGSAVPGVTVIFTPLDANSRSPAMTVDSTTMSGEYSAYLYPGRYSVMVQRHLPPLFFREELEVPEVPHFTHDLEVPTLTLVGRLLDASNNRPMSPGVELVLEPVRDEGSGDNNDNGAMSGFAELFSRYAGQIRTTEEDGSYRWEGVAPGRYHLRAYAEGYGLVVVQNLDVRGDGDVEVPTMYFETQASLSLSVTDTVGQPIAGAALTITDSQGRNLTLIDSVVTDNDGHALVPYLQPDDTYTIRAAAAGYAPAQITYAPAGVMEGYAGMTLQTGGAVQVEVVNRHGEPAIGASVRLYDATGNFVPPQYTQAQMYQNPGSTDDSGRVLRSALAPGRYTVRVTHNQGTAQTTIDIQATGPGADPQHLRIHLQN